MSCDQAIFVDHAASASLSSHAVLPKIDRFGQRFQRRGAVQGAVRPVLIMVGLVLGQHPAQVVLIDDQRPIEQLTSQGADDPFADRVGLHRRLHPIQMIGTGVSG
jgi:hypothetical protein